MGRIVLTNLRRAMRDRDGVAAAEWALIAGSIVIAVAAAMPGIKTSLTNVFSIISSALG